MKTIVLPGFSPNNKAWAGEICVSLNQSMPTIAVNWRHWETGAAEPGWIAKEVARVIGLMGGERSNILAKSIGTAVAMELVKQEPELVDKLILCGVPTRDLRPGDEIHYESLRTFPVDKVLCIQNEGDNHGSLAEAEKFIHSFNLNLKIISKPRSDHEYLYLEDFRNFLLS